MNILSLHRNWRTAKGINGGDWDGMSKATVLVVEDERIVARDLQATLSRAGYQVPSIAASGEDAIKRAAELKPDLVLMDIVLQGELDGVAAAKVIRHQLGIPVIYLTSSVDGETLERAKTTEPIGYVLKPFEACDLVTTIEMALHQFTSNRHRTESALLASEARFRTIFESADWGIALVDRDGFIREANPAFCNLLGFDTATLSDARISDFVPPEDREVERSQHEDLFEGRIASYKVHQPCRKKDGKVIWTRSSVSAFPAHSSAPGEQPEFALRMVEDLTEEKRLQDQCLRAQRMETIGTLTSGLVHNLNNILTPAVMGVQMLRAEPDADTEELLDTLENSLMRGVSIIKQLLGYGRGSGSEPKRGVVDLPKLLQEVLGLARGLFPSRIATEIEVSGNILPVIGDPNQLHQAILNLCVNARDAIEGAGRITLGLANAEIEPAKARIYPHCTPGPHVAITIKDTGCGMSEEVQKRLFEPFFTTKPEGKGTGLGLASTLGIIKAHGGIIEVKSEPGSGTEFRIYLPANVSTS